jgi:hypothetical protein
MVNIAVGPHLERKKHKNRPSTSAGGDTVKAGGSSLVIPATPNTTSNTTTDTNTVTPTNSANTNIAHSDTTTSTSIGKENEKPNASDSRVTDVAGITKPDAVLSTSENGKYRLSPDMAIALPHDWNHKRYQVSQEKGVFFCFFFL